MIARNNCSRSNEMSAHHRVKSPLTITEMRTSVAKELGLRDLILRRWAEKLGRGEQPTAAQQRTITQAALPSADHAAEIARLMSAHHRVKSPLTITEMRSPAARPTINATPMVTVGNVSSRSAQRMS